VVPITTSNGLENLAAIYCGDLGFVAHLCQEKVISVDARECYLGFLDLVGI
jgi:hypothetical protein